MGNLPLNPPFACLYPDAKAVGVDLSSVQIEQGQELIRRIGLKNLSLHAMSISDITPDFGTFDYIIVHGVFSWVPPEVRDAILRICRENLSPTGVAYISYNCYPGWKSGEIVRDAMLFHSHFAAEDDKVDSAKAMLTLLSEGLAQSTPLRSSLLAAVNQLKKQNDYYIAHEYLETFNNPCYFIEFADTVTQTGLTHVGDAEPRLETSAYFGNNVQLNHSLIALGQNRLLRQQYLDFAVGRNFRKSMLVPAKREAEISTSPDLTKLAELQYAGRFLPAKADEGTPENAKAFLDHRGNKLHYTDAAMIAIVERLNTAWPHAVSGKELLQVAEQAGEAKPQACLEKLFYLGRHFIAKDQTDLPTSLKSAAEALQLLPGALEIMRWRRDVTPGIGQFNVWHDHAGVQLTEPEWILVQHMDGTQKTPELRKRLIEAWQRGSVPDRDGTSLKRQRNLEAKADKVLTDLLALLRRQGLLA